MTANQITMTGGKESDYLISTNDAKEYEKYTDASASFVEHTWDYGPTPRPRPIPWRALIMAVCLIILGSLFILGGVSIVLGLIKFESLDSFTPYAVMVIGLICLIPGVYHVVVLCCACNGNRSFSFDNIPNFD